MNDVVSVARTLAMLLNIGCVPGEASGKAVVGGDVISKDAVIVGGFRTVVYADRKGKQARASGYIRSVGRDSFTIGRGLWTEEILFSRVIPGELLEVGSRVRVSASRRITGTLVSAGVDSLTVRPEFGAAVAISRSPITRLEISQGVHSRGAVGGLLGLLSGAVLGTSVAYMKVTEERTHNSGFGWQEPWDSTTYHNVREALASDILITGFGLAVGIIIGRKSTK